MTKFVVIWTETRDGGSREERHAVIECGNKLKEIYDALIDRGLFEFEIRKATIHVVSDEFSGQIVVEGPH